MPPVSLPFELHGFWVTSAALFAIVTARYFLFAGAFYFFLYKKGFAAARKIRPEPPAPGMIRKEILWSLVTCTVFAISGAWMIHQWAEGHTLIYTRIEEHGWVWFFASLPVLMLLHETYFYWTHRWIHHKAIFRWVHRVHHESHNPTPWAAFSFHWTEALVQAAILPALVFVVPTHPIILLTFLMVMTVLGVINHLGYELYPRGMETTFFGREFINASHHYLHHHRARSNYGLYFTFWDRWMGTESADSLDLYREVTNRKATPNQLPKAA